MTQIIGIYTDFKNPFSSIQSVLSVFYCILFISFYLVKIPIWKEAKNKTLLL
jgi:hypothetical protein